MAGVELRQLVKRYGSVQVVHGIDLSVAEREFVVLVGPSGCGKSTTLRMIAGLEEITKGDLRIDGREMGRVAPKDRDVAMVFQNYALYPHLKVADNIAFGLRIRRTPKDEIERQVAEVAEILGLTDYLERRPADLSGGQRQRVAMGRAIVRHPKVFLFDEPLSNLDAKLRTQMRAEIKRLHNRLGVTSIYVTHDQVEAMTLADRIVVMNEGRIEQVGAPMELFLDPVNLFVAGFLGAPPMNQLAGVLESGAEGPIARIGTRIGTGVGTRAGTGVGVGTHEARIALPDHEGLHRSDGRPVVLGIRPEYTRPTIGAAPGRVPVELELVETLGSEALLHARCMDEPFIIKAETHTGLDHLRGVDGFTIEPGLVKVFDGETGRVLNAGAPTSAAVTMPDGGILMSAAQVERQAR